MVLFGSADAIGDVAACSGTHNVAVDDDNDDRTSLGHRNLYWNAAG